MEELMFDNWRTLIRPKGVVSESKGDSSTFGKFEVRPLERGFGTTLGNALRRILLSSLQGSAIVGVKIDGVLHEFSTISGVKEDVSDIILNLKQVRLKLHDKREATLRIKLDGEKNVTAADIDAPSNVEIMNPDQHIMTLGPNAKIDMELYVRMGNGYEAADKAKAKEFAVGTIMMDALFSPVRRVNYTVTNARVGQITDYDALNIELRTDGSIRPEDALALAAKIIKEQVQVFINFDEVAEPEVILREEDKPSLNENLYRRVDELELSVRSANCLQNANIKHIGELCQYTEAEMLKTKNFGRKSLNEIKEILASMGLSLGLKMDGFDPKDADKYRPRDVD